MRVAIVGCGQLARMLALAGIPLSIKFSFIADGGEGTDTACVDGLGTIVPWQEGDDFQALYEALGKPDVVTVEKEQVNLQLLEGLSSFTTLHPNKSAVKTTKSRLLERLLIESLSIPVAKYCLAEDIDRAADILGYPFVIKSLEDGYDGKNQWQIKTKDEFNRFLAESEQVKSSVLAEQWINFKREVSLVGVRSTNGDVGFYPLAENKHHNGILIQSIAPAADVSVELYDQAKSYLKAIMDKLDYVGVMAVEFFETDDGLIVNELAPRVHNSGHYTQSASISCQFENHVRAITELPLGSTKSLGVAAMLNVIGDSEPPLAAVGEVSTLHWYNKEPRPGRKLGHINFIAPTMNELLKEVQKYNPNVM